MRAVPGALAGQAGHGVDRARLTSGVEGLTRLFKASVSAQWIKEAMEGWGEDLVRLLISIGRGKMAEIGGSRSSWSCGQPSTRSLHFASESARILRFRRRARGAPPRVHSLTS